MVKLGLIKLLQKRFDLCEEAYVVEVLLFSLVNVEPPDRRKANATVTCPVPQGELHITQTVALPKEIPRGMFHSNNHVLHLPAVCVAKFTVDVRGYTADDEDMVCVKLNVDFLPKTPFPRIRW